MIVEPSKLEMLARWPTDRPDLNTKLSAALTKASLIDATEHWGDGKYPYLLYATRQGEARWREMSVPTRCVFKLRVLASAQEGAQLLNGAVTAIPARRNQRTGGHRRRPSC